MHYDYSTVLDRRNIGSVKWDEMATYGVTGEGIVPLSNAEMEFANAPEITEGLQEFVGKRVLSYFQPTPDYFEAVKGWFCRRHGFTLETKNILPNHNIHVASATVVAAFTEPGDGVIVMEPTWPGFFGAIEQQNREKVVTELINRNGYYEIDFDDFEKKAADPKNKMLFLCSPHNPVGRVWTRAELQRIVDICCDNNVLIISDELHCDIVMPGYKHIPVATLSERAAQNSITFVGCSKAFNIAGLDISNVIIYNEELSQRYRKERASRGMTRPNMLGVAATQIALERGEAWLEGAVEVIAKNAAYVEQFVAEKMPLITCTHLEATYLMWLDLRKLGLDIHVMEQSLMRDAQLFMDDGFYFGVGGEGFERMNVAVPHQVIIDAMERLYQWYKKQIMA